MTRKYFFFFLLFASFITVNAQNKITYTVADCTVKTVTLSCTKAYRWEILDKKLKTKPDGSTYYVDTLVVREAVKSGSTASTLPTITYTFNNKGYYYVKAYYYDNFDEGVDEPAETYVTMAPYADFQVTQVDNVSLKDSVDVTFKALYSNPACTYVWTGDITGNTQSFTKTKTAEMMYTVKLTTTLGSCIDSSTVNIFVRRSQLNDTLIVRKDTIGSFPNVFTPNNDGANDVFYIPTPVLSYTDGTKNNQYTFEVYNRGGMLIYKSVSPVIQWDGRTLTGEKAKPGTYFYTVKLNNTPLPSKKKAVHMLMIFE
jgi:gliding motility-associated-like protein